MVRHSGKPIRPFLAAALLFLDAGAAATAADDSILPVLAEGEVLRGGLKSLVGGKKGGRTSVSGTFELAGRSISFETRRGRPTDPAEQEGGGPMYEMDVCFKDGRGRPLVTQSGGDEFLIPDCDPERQEEPKYPEADRQQDYEALVKAIEVLGQLRFNEYYEPERRALTGQLRLARDLVKGLNVPAGAIIEDEK